MSVRHAKNKYNNQAGMKIPDILFRSAISIDRFNYRRHNAIYS